MDSRSRRFAVSTLIGMGLFSSAKAQFDKAINFKDSSSKTDYRFTLTGHSYPYHASEYYQPFFDLLGDGVCGANTSVDCIPVYYATLQEWARNNYLATLYRGAGQAMNQSFEDCLKFLINISDERYKQFLDTFNEDQKKKTETGTTILYSSLGVMGGLLAIFLISMTIFYCNRLKKAKQQEASVAEDQVDTAVMALKK